MEFHLTSDFRDDFTSGEARWTKDRFREYIRIIADLGMKGIHWVEMGDADMGKWDRGSSTDLHGRSREFVEEIPNPLAFLCEEGHRLGMKVYAVHKINDMASFGPGRFYPLGAAPSVLPGIPQIGGSGQMAFRWLRDHPDKRMEIHPSLLEPPGMHKPVRAIRLWHGTDQLGNIPEIELLVSETNGSYAPYEGSREVKVSVERRKPPVYTPAPEKRFAEEGSFTCVEISGLQISQPFFAIRFTEKLDMVNTLTALMEVEDSDGGDVAFTWGFAPRSDYSKSLGDFREVGIGFDANWDTPFEDFPRGYQWQHSAERYRLNLGKVPFVGVARGRNQFLSSSVELAYPEVREWLLEMVQYEINAGCDGVDIRLECHTQNMDFENYGFGQPIIEAFHTRYGIDITREPFDRGAWRKLRGEYFDLFLKEVSDLLLAHGKERWVHLTGFPLMDEQPSEPSPYQIYWNWEKWLREGWVDVVNLKRFQGRDLPPEYERRMEEFYQKVLNCCGELQLPMAFTPNGGNRWKAMDDIVKGELQNITRIFQDGFHVYNIYEANTYIHLRENGFDIDAEELWERVREMNQSDGSESGQLP